MQNCSGNWTSASEFAKISGTFLIRIMRRLRTTGSFHSKSGSGRNRLHTKDQEIEMIDYFSANPRTSIRNTSVNLELSRTSINRILEKHNWYPFCIYGLQALHPSDFDRL